MKLNIIQCIKDIYFNIKQILCVYFTSFPYYIYNIGSNNSNFGICGIGLGLIQAQRIFWLSIATLTFIYYLKHYINVFIYLFFVYISFLLINRSLTQTINLLKLINVQNCRSTP